MADSKLIVEYLKACRCKWLFLFLLLGKWIYHQLMNFYLLLIDDFSLFQQGLLLVLLLIVIAL
ncbi:hypothetical protein ASC74_07535 [Pseudomonas sp. Root329]|nr:hypothetical protein ASC74_07535 [Pseudomonas sp. Root329]